MHCTHTSEANLIEFDTLTIPSEHGELPGLLHVPAGARWLYVLAHGAGAGMRHGFMTDIAERLAARAVATLRYEFPYMTTGAKRPDPAARLESSVRAAVAFAARGFAQLRIAAGGKSMGGRITSQALAAEPMPRLERLIFLGFPLHAAGREPNPERAAHLERVEIPMLFLQGTRDTLADLALMRQVCATLGDRATLHVVDGADHSFKVLKRTGRTDEQALDELASQIATWLSTDDVA
jgi:predicted alpha/beta-hydrolase family hydrolase